MLTWPSSVPPWAYAAGVAGSALACVGGVLYFAGAARECSSRALLGLGLALLGVFVWSVTYALGRGRDERTSGLRSSGRVTAILAWVTAGVIGFEWVLRCL